MPPHPASPSPSTSTLPSQFAPQSPEMSTRYSPELVKRMQASTCYSCGHEGHWSWDCPVSSPNKKPLPRSLNHDSPLNPTRIFCRCGHGLCLVKTSQSERNPGRKYYACPISRGKPCREFIQFCDIPIDESYMQPPPYKYPECECRAGVCRKVMDPDADKYYFACPIAEGHGSCGYKLWEDELLDGNKSVAPIQQSSQKQCDLGEGGDLLVEHSKRMTTMAVCELSEGDNAATKAVPSRRVGFPEFEVADDPPKIVDSVPADAVEREAFLLSHQPTPSRISGGQNLFQSNSFAGAAAGADASFGVFPSPDRIAVPKQAIIGDDPCECNQLSISNHSEDAQLSSNGSHTEASRDALSGSLINSQGSGRKPMSKAERQRQMVVSTLQRLLKELEYLDPDDHESMRVAAEDTFALLDDLSIDYKQFSKHVWDFINNASVVAKINRSMENAVTLEECNQHIEEERARFAQVQEECVKTKALLEASNQQRQRLCEEVSHLEAMLHEKRNQLNSCELESVKIETHLGDLKRRMLEADTTLKGRVEEAELARRLNEERQTKQMAAKAALEKAKQELEN